MQQQRHQTKREESYRIFHNNTAPTASANMRNSAGMPAVNRAVSSSTTATAIQLTPLWEHILRTRKLPDSICPRIMFAEFLERLKDPEWQVRQHALRVFVDVLVVMKARADPFMEPLIGQLVENLGHQAPTVRKGALDCLRVYLAETAMPETIMLQILDIGLNQKITNEPFGGRLTCGVMLSLPALVQSTLHTPKSHFILRATIDMLVQKMGQVTHQEITLKVLRKMRELIGEAEFMKYMSHGAYREFDLLCNVYGLSAQDEGLLQPTSANFITCEANTNTWRLMAANKPSKLANCWRSSEEEKESRLIEEECANEPVLACPAKVIMETEIKINDDTLTMRILEAKDDDVCLVEPEMCNKSSVELCPNSLEDEVICGRIASAKSLRESSSSLVKLLSDSDDMEEEKKPRETYYTTVVTPSTPSRTPKRVTFGGEVVKMRTPDSDANSTTNNNHQELQQQQQQQPQNHQQLFMPTDNQAIIKDHNDNKNQQSPPFILQSPPINMEETSKTSILTLDIPNDNTKPLTRPKSGPTLKSSGTISKVSSPAASSQTNSPKSPAKSPKDALKSPLRRLSISPVDNIVSPRTAHKEIEVLHNLQRDPSPNRALTARRASLKAEELNTPSPVVTQPLWMDSQSKQFQQSPNAAAANQPPPPPPRSWEELGIVDYDTIMDLRSGNWRHRLQGVQQLEQALRSSENLARVQPCLDSLLRTLLSAECRAEVAEEKRKLLINLITRLPLDNLEDRTMQIMSGLCRQGGAGANRVCKALMQRLPPSAIVLKLISQEFLHAKSSRFREHALQMAIFALMTFPSTCFDIETCVTSATYAALNRKRRVRQAALDVIAVLGQISSAREVLDVVQQIANSRDDGAALVAAVKTRLSRKQLPLVSSEGAVQYSLHVPPSQIAANVYENEAKLKNENNNNTNNNCCNAYNINNANGDFDKTSNANGQQGPDIDWITAGIGSVSPTSIKKRAHRIRTSGQQSFSYLSTQGSSTSDDPVHRPSLSNPADLLHHSKGCEKDDNHHHNNYNFHHVFASNPYNYGLSTKKSNADYPYYTTTRRLVANSCSDSSIDGRSSDSNYTSSGGSAVSNNDIPLKNNGGGDGITGRFTRQAVNSRFPTMDMNTTYRVHKPPTYYPGMGAYAHLQQQQYNMNSTYPKVNYTLNSQQYHHTQLAQRRKSQNHYTTQQQQQQQHQQQQPQQSPPYYYINNNTNRAQHFNHHNANTITNTSNKGNYGNQENLKMSETAQHKDLNPAAADNLDGTYTISPGGTKLASQQTSATIGRRFVNVDKFLNQSNKSSQTSNGNVKEPENQQQPQIEQQSEDIETQSQKTPTPSSKSTTYSQKSTASAQSSNGSRSSKENFVDKPLTEDKEDKNSIKNDEDIVTTPLTTVETTVTETAEMAEVTSESPSKWKTGEDVLQVEDVIDGENQIQNVYEEIQEKNTKLERNGSLASLQSKSESIKTQLEDTPPALSRAQSAKSLVIEEDIEDNTSFVVVEEVEQMEDINKEQINVTEDNETQDEIYPMATTPGSGKSRLPVSRRQSPTIEEIKALSRRNSMVKSMESLYERPPSKHEYTDNTTETSSQSSAQFNSSTGSTSIPIKTLRTPLKVKSKTTHFLKSHRRVSPVKQSIKMQQAELYPASLQRFEKPREAIMKTFDQLDSTNWEVIMLGLKNLVRLMRYHPENLDPQMHMICIQLTKSVRNLRSQVARAACTAATEMFTIRSRYLEQECDDLVHALLHRTADTNRFIRADAARALESMCDNLTPQKILNILTTKGAQHPHALVRTTTAKLLNRLVERLSYEKVYTMPRDQRDKFFITGANLLLEGSLETRSYAKSLFKLLSDHPNYHRLLLEVIPTRTYRNIEKTLKSIR